jgi:Universal stress protein family
MSRLIAAVNDDAASAAVLLNATALARLFGAQVEALHVGPEQATLSAAASTADVPIRSVPGEIAATLAQAVSAPDVVALVIGAHGERTERRPGATALQVIVRQDCPVVVVPPDAPPRPAIESVLVPLDGTPMSAAALEDIVELARDASLRIVVAHVQAPEDLPAFSNHLPHETRAWSEEFIARHCPAAGEAALEVRVGDPRGHVVDILRESRCDLVALGWRQNLGPGRAAIVSRLLAESRVPVLLTPVRAQPGWGEAGQADEQVAHGAAP